MSKTLDQLLKRLAAIQERVYSPEELKRMMQDAEEKIKAKREFEKAKKELEEEQRRILKERREREEVEEDERRERREKARIRRELRVGPETKKDPMVDRPKVKDPKKIEQERAKVEEYLRKQQPSEHTPSSSKTKEELRTEQLKLLEEAETEATQPKVEVSKPKTKEELRAEQLRLLEEAEIEATEPTKTRPLSIKEEREMVEKFVQQQKGDEEEIEKLLKDPSLVEQPPEGGWKCMTEGHGDRPATIKLRHNEILGEGMPTLTFCRECAGKLKMTPIMENKPSKALLRRLSSLSNQLDSKGLFKEADFIDELIKKLSSAAGWRQTPQQGGEDYGEPEEKPEKKRWPKKKSPEAPAKPKITCMTEGHRDRPAVMRLEHNKVLGDEIPDLAFCEECALRMRLIPIESKRQPLTRRFSSRDFGHKQAADMTPDEYKKYYGKEMDRERLKMWKSQQEVENKESGGVLDLFQGPDKEELEERLDKIQPKPIGKDIDAGKKSLVDILGIFRRLGSVYNARAMGTITNPNNIAVALKFNSQSSLSGFLQGVDQNFPVKVSGIPVMEFSHVISDGLVGVYSGGKTMQSYPAAHVVVVFMHWAKLTDDDQIDFREVIEQLFVRQI